MAFYGIPNNGIDPPNLGVYLGLVTWPRWMHRGEGLELGVDVEVTEIIVSVSPPGVFPIIGETYNVTFKNVITGEEGNLLNKMDWAGNCKYVVITGNRNPWRFWLGWGDGAVKKDWCVPLPGSSFEPIIYASHDHNGEHPLRAGSSGEFSLTECTYVTEFIKKWMIDDEDTYYGAYFVDKPSVGPVGYPPYSLRVWPKINDYKKALTIDISLIRPDNGQLIKRKTVPIFRCHQEFLPYFIGAPVIHTNWTETGGGYSGNVSVEVTINDMKDGKTYTKTGKWLVFERDGPVKTHLIYPNGKENLIAGKIYPIKWENNDGFVKAYLYYSISGGVNWIIIDSTNENTYHNSPFTYNWFIPLSHPPGIYSNCKVKVITWLDGVGLTELSDESDNPFTITVPAWQPKNLSAFATAEEVIRLLWQHYPEFIYDSIQVFRKPDLYGNNQFGRIKKLPGYATMWFDFTCEWNMTYYYKLRAFKYNYASTYSNIASATTNRLNTPTQLHLISSSPEKIVIGWKDNSNYETGYEIWRRRKSGNNWGKWTIIDTVPQNSIAYTDTHVEVNREYRYKVRAIRTGGYYSWFSDSVYVNTYLGIIATGNVSLSRSSGKAIIYKNGYHVVYSKDNKVYYAYSNNGLQWNSQYVDNGIEPSVAYMSNKICVFYLDENYRFKYAKKEGNNWVKFTPGLPFIGTNLSVRTYEMYVDAGDRDTVAFVSVETYAPSQQYWKLRIYKVFSTGQDYTVWDYSQLPPDRHASLGTVCTDSIYKDTIEQKYVENGLAIFTVSPNILYGVTPGEWLIENLLEEGGGYYPAGGVNHFVLYKNNLLRWYFCDPSISEGNVDLSLIWEYTPSQNILSASLHKDYVVFTIGNKVYIKEKFVPLKEIALGETECVNVHTCKKNRK